MVRRSIAALGISMAALFLGLALSDISDTARQSWTDSASQAFSCSTGVATSCALTLTSAHAFPSTSGMSVVETSPASARPHGPVVPVGVPAGRHSDGAQHVDHLWVHRDISGGVVDGQHAVVAGAREPGLPAVGGAHHSHWRGGECHGLSRVG